MLVIISFAVIYSYYYIIVHNIIYSFKLSHIYSCYHIIVHNISNYHIYMVLISMEQNEMYMLEFIILNEFIVQSNNVRT